jgi:predicted PurR-regulated permease PerM
VSDELAPVTTAAPAEMRDPLVRTELKRAGVWFGIAVAIAMTVLLIQPLMLIFAGLVFASMLDGGARLLGRVLPIGRNWRVALVLLLAILFLIGTIYQTGVEIREQFQQLSTTLQVQGTRFLNWLNSLGALPAQADLMSMARQSMGSVGRLTSYVGSVFGAFTSTFLVIIIGLFVALEPRLYERGLAWLMPSRSRGELEITLGRMAYTMRRLLAGRLLGMLIQGVATWIALTIGGVPMALVLGILTGILAFIPNVGAFVSGVLMVAVGFSAGVGPGLWALGTYLVVQTLDGYVLTPLIARKTVDLPPALVLGAQILFSTLLGFMGLLLADPITAMIKVWLERGSEREQEKAAAPAPQ